MIIVSYVNVVDIYISLICAPQDWGRGWVEPKNGILFGVG